MNEEVKMNFDYDVVNKDHLDAVNEILSIIKSRPNVPISFIEEEIKQKFNIESIPEKDLKKSLWYKLTEEFVQAGMEPVLQGHSIKVEDGHKVKVPLIALSGDLDKFNEFAEKLVMKIKGELSDTDKTSK
jgi:hypothetical protein